MFERSFVLSVSYFFVNKIRYDVIIMNYVGWVVWFVLVCECRCIKESDVCS